MGAAHDSVRISARLFRDLRRQSEGSTMAPRNRDVLRVSSRRVQALPNTLVVSPPSDAQAGELDGARTGIFPGCLNLGKGTPIHPTHTRIAVSSQSRILPKHPIVPVGHSVGIHLVHRSRRHNARVGLATNALGGQPFPSSMTLEGAPS